MKKILLTEAQAILVEKFKAEKALLENVERTKGGYAVRNLIKEGEVISGEYKNYYGKWHTTSWNADGIPTTSLNKFEEVIYTLPLNEQVG